MDNEYLVWRRFGHGASANIYANTNAGAHVDVDDLACAHFGTDDVHYGTNASTDVDVQLQWGALWRCFALPIEVGLLRRLRRLLQRGVDLEGSRLLRRVHAHVLQCFDVCAEQHDSGTSHDHCSPDAGTHVDYLTCARTVANHDHCGADAGTHLDVQLQRGALRRCLSLPIGVGLVRPLRLSLQRAVDLERSGLLWRRVHHRAARVHVLLQCVDVRAEQPDAGTISGCWWQWDRGVVHAGRFRRLLSEHQQCGLHGGELLHARRAGAGGFGVPQFCQFGRRRGG
mmetsp:Transcript_57461/g.163740  ORF Transcript_57461/g.163740 Transcript_57461/m.163740 type:complete len:284 (-) Transcript_57461:859-1710(-)